MTSLSQAAMLSSSPIVQYACFNTIFEIVCTGSRDLIVFEAARYGRNDTRGAHICDVPLTRSCDIDVQYPLSRTCGGRRRCSLAVNTAFFDDPCGHEEFLKVTYRCVPGVDIFRRCSDPWTSATANPVNYISHGYLASPNYPGKYYMDAECQWTLRVQRGQTLRITLFDFELDVKRGGSCHNFLAITSRNVTKFKDCGALGKQVVDINHHTAVISFKTGQTSLTQRGFILYHEAVGEGCPVLHTDDVTQRSYYLDDDSVLHLNASCNSGHDFMTGGASDEVYRLYKCRGTTWNDVIPRCKARTLIPPTTLGDLPASTSTGWLSTSSPASDDQSASIVGVALGAVSGLLLLVLCLLIVVCCTRRSSGQRKKEQWRMVVNNLQENERNDVTKYIYDDKYLEPLTSAASVIKRHNCNNVQGQTINPDESSPNRNVADLRRLSQADDSGGSTYCQLQRTWVVTDGRGGSRALIAAGGFGRTLDVPLELPPRPKFPRGCERLSSDRPPDLITCRGKPTALCDEHRCEENEHLEAPGFMDPQTPGFRDSLAHGHGDLQAPGYEDVLDVTSLKCPISPCCPEMEDHLYASSCGDQRIGCTRLGCRGLNRSAPSALDSPPGGQDIFVL